MCRFLQLQQCHVIIEVLQIVEFVMNKNLLYSNMLFFVLWFVTIVFTWSKPNGTEIFKEKTWGKGKRKLENKNRDKSSEEKWLTQRYHDFICLKMSIGLIKSIGSRQNPIGADQYTTKDSLKKTIFNFICKEKIYIFLKKFLLIKM